MPAVPSQLTRRLPFAVLATACKQYITVASGHGGGSIPLSGSATIVIFGL